MVENNLSQADREKLFLDNQRLVHYIIWNKANVDLRNAVGYDYEDFVSIGNIELLKACKYYNSDVSKFSTYATMIIYNEIMMEFRKIKRNKIMNEAISLHTPLPDMENYTLEDITIDPHASIDYCLDQREISLDNFYKILNEIECKIVKLRYDGLSQHEIGKIMNISRPQIARLLKKIKIKFKNWIKELY